MNQVQIKGLILEVLEEVSSCLPSPAEKRGRGTTLETVEEMKGNRCRQVERGLDGRLE